MLKKINFQIFYRKNGGVQVRQAFNMITDSHQNDSQYYVQLTRKEINSKKNCQSEKSYNIFL